MKYNNKCMFVRDKKAQNFNVSEIEGKSLVLYSDGNKLEDASIASSDIYGCVFCDEIRNISFITKGADSKVLACILLNDGDYNAMLGQIKRAFPDIKFSAQNNKITSYANSISDKLRSGIEVALFDSVADDSQIECPSCGVLNDWNPDMPYCMECGMPLK